MKKWFLLPALLLAFVFSASGKEYRYGQPEKPWEESLGNHRAVVKVTRAAQAAQLDFRWRRHGADPAAHRFLIVDAATGDTVRNVLRRRVDSEVCDIVFGPVSAGTYYFYYLPFTVSPDYGYCMDKYLEPEDTPEAGWAAALESGGEQPVRAKVRRVESRTAFDSFYPMELAATADEEAAYLSANEGTDLFVFPEDRKYPAAMRDRLPSRWLGVRQGSGLRGTAAPEEYYAFQACVWTPRDSVGLLSYSVTDLKDGNTVIPASAVTCFNTEGTGPYGDHVTFDVSVPKGRVQPLWFGIDLPKSIRKGTFKGTLTIRDDAGREALVPLTLKVKGKPLEARGDNEPWRHSRLRWLNSTLGSGDAPVAPYIPMSNSGDTVQCLGRGILFDRSTGAPLQIRSWGNDILSAPIRLVIVSGGKEMEMPDAQVRDIRLSEGSFTGECFTENDVLSVRCEVRFEFDGWMSTRYTVQAKRDIALDDIRLEIPVKEEVGTCFMGLGLHAALTPRSVEATWDGAWKAVGPDGRPVKIPEGDDFLYPFDGFWIGRHDAGLQFEFRGSSYSGPMLNLYHPPYPDSWHNGGRGGFRLTRGSGSVRIQAYSGPRSLAAGASTEYEYALIVTPVKQVTPEARFVDRYYHGSPLKPSDENIALGARIVNVHHATPVNPFINYPYMTTDTLRRFTEDLHAKGCKVKIYYTVRELSSILPEIWALRSLGHEVLAGDNGVAPGKGYPWLQEHLESDYTHQWYQHFDFDVPGNVAADAALLTADGDSRWFNYYIEGLSWVLRNLDVDGLYMDDVAFDRRILKRMRRVMESVKPGCLIDLHSNTWFSRGPAVQYTEFFPYIDKIWFGESFKYNEMDPACWLVECSGVPFGLPGEMLQDGGNRWLGMQYGMTARMPWSGERAPVPVWKVWDEFGITEARMAGYWEERPAVSTGDPLVKATAYIKEGRTLLSIGNYAEEDRTVSLDIDWKQLGLDPSKCTLKAPEVEDFQSACTWKPGERISIAAKRGWLIYVE